MDLTQAHSAQRTQPRNPWRAAFNWPDALNLPNRVTYARLLLIIPVAVLALQPGWYGVVGFWLFILAASTDWVDGWLAKRNNGALMTAWGALIDPIVDKLLTLTALSVAIARGEDWLRPHLIVVTVLIVIREAAVFRTRIGQRVASAGEAGRFSMVALSIALTMTLLPQFVVNIGGLHLQWTRTETLVYLLYFAAGTSLASGWGYWAAWRKARKSP